MNNFSKFSDVCKNFDEGEKHKTETFINRNGNKRKDLNRNSATSKTMYSTRNGSRKKMISCSFKPRKEPSFESVKDVPKPIDAFRDQSQIGCRRPTTTHLGR